MKMSTFVLTMELIMAGCMVGCVITGEYGNALTILALLAVNFLLDTVKK
jgi:hypothetical protein